MNSSASRLQVVDALRGFAIVSIMLLHNLEHFDYYYIPESLPRWLTSLDNGIWDGLFFMFAGKSYAIFSLLFGLTFYIQAAHQEKHGKDFRARFAWRLLLLLGFGIFNSLFYQGDILTIYAIIGFILIPLARAGNKIVLLCAVLMMLQPYELYYVLRGLIHPDLVLSDPLSWSYFGRMGQYITGDSIFATWTGNLLNGKPAVLLWNWENGRVFQTASLFLLGMLAGRKSLFVPSEQSFNFWKKTLIFASIAFIPLFILKTKAGDWITPAAVSRPLVTIVTTWSNLSFMLVLVSGFTLLFSLTNFRNTLRAFSSLGRMSMTNYIMQSVLGSFIYYGYGLGLYKYTGASSALIIGITLAVFQGWFSSWWLRRHDKGPLESLWHKATWAGTGI